MDDNKNMLIQYAGLAAQLLVGLAAFTYLGLWLDKKMGNDTHLFIWLLPLLLLIGMLVKAIKDTNKK